MLSSRTGNRRRKRSGKKSNQLYKPKIECTDDGFVVTTLYIKSLGKEITRNHLVDYFTKYGKVQNVRIHTKANGFGFVTFATPESASKVLQCRFHKINGKEVTIAIAHSWHQEKPLEQSNNHKTKPVKLPIELTNATGTYLTDLNDDCLYEIFSHTSPNILDLCSVAETCTRLKAIATRIFAKAHKTCKFNEMSLNTIHEMRRMLINFSSSITDLTIGSFNYDCSSLLPVIAKNCTDLEKLNITGYSNDGPYNFVKALKSLLALKKLTKLKIKCDGENVTKFIKELHQLTSLEFLKLQRVDSDEEFILTLSQLKNLKVLRLRDCYFLPNVDALANLEKLTELSIKVLDVYKIVDIELDIVALVKRLTDLKKITVGLDSFTVDRRMYLQLVNVVRERPGRLPSSLEVKAFDIEDDAFDIQLDGKNHEFVTLDILHFDDSEYDAENDSYMSDDYSDSDFDPYFLDDADSDDYDFPAAFLLPFLQQQIMNHFGGGSDDEDSDQVDDDNDAEDEDTEVW